jgi:hypothetical protein
MALLLLAAKVWHYWIAYVLVAAAVLTVLGFILGYIVKVVAPKYVRR